MMKQITTLLLLSLLALSLIGCADKTTETGAPGGDAQVLGQDSISGDITGVDTLDSDLSDVELQDVSSQLDEMDW